MLRIDTHHHAIPAFYRDMLQKAEIDEASGRALPDWSPEGSLATMAELNVETAILSVSTPGTAFLRAQPTPHRSRATSTTTSAKWSPVSPTGSDFSPPYPCRTSVRLSPSSPDRSTN